MNKLSWEKLDMFLSGTFHQDIESPEEALEEYINEVGKEWLKEIVFEAESFLSSDLSLDDKSEFIQSRAELYFPAMGQSPTEWLESVVKHMKYNLADSKGCDSKYPV